ncbi:MAG: sulfatase-like hydrolase/transferase [Clostridia bacterium]|nr:sulfatase-like hydrolase/transferase [Clostridia bacterium]
MKSLLKKRQCRSQSEGKGDVTSHTPANNCAISHIIKNTAGFIKNYYFCIFAIIALLLPDLQLRFLVWPKIYGTFYATVFPVAFDLGWIGIFLLAAVTLLPKRAGKIAYMTIGGVFIFFGFAQYIYFQIFGQFFRVSSIGLAGEGGEYLAYALSHIDIKLIVSTLLAIGCLAVAGKKWHRPERVNIGARFTVIVPIALLVGLHIYMQPSLFGESEQDWNSWCRPRVVYKEFTDTNKSVDIVGLYHFAARDIYKTYLAGNKYSRKDFERVDEYFEQKAASASTNEYTGMFEGKNVIGVMLEGIDDWLISDKYTPVMKYMMKNGINFANHYAPGFGTGYTLGSEFCFHTVYYTPISGVSAVNYVSNKFPDALPQLFKEKGYSVNSFHFNNPEFYNRVIMHHSLGYEKYHSFMDYGLEYEEAQSDSNILKHEQIYNDIVKNEPFFSYIITYSGHVPYDKDDAKLSNAKANHPELIDKSMSFEQNACYLLARDTDDFFRMLLEKLHADGLLDNTVIVVYTDHYAYGYSDQDKLTEYNKSAGDDINYRVPAFIYTPGLEPMKITKPTQTADLLPTLINLFGLEDRHTYIGNDAMSPDYRGFAYFNNYEWIDGDMYYDPAVTPVTAENQQAVEAGNEKIRECFDINDIVVVGDYFAHRD